ncbi:FGFR1 oncogene partner 2 homolog [Hermetia illucens]|uniref:FGFR1 oncogene partner 2 homolog n=1 Tax=Hermetia illucens TaxID=343691 RepID=UPI0018CC2B53|nr:FGFR1 oncogene partner 2 homolog [Hermetia illucens]
MSITVGQIILDAQRVANGAKDLEARTNALLVEAEGNNRQIETMKQFRDDLDSLNKLCRDKSNADMVNRINQQNPSIREIRQENRELKASLEDHQRALELIMHKYREHMHHKILNSKVNLKDTYNAKLSEVVRQQEEKISEMAAVMQKAASMDDEALNRELEMMQRLRIENQGLREMLQISQQFGSASCRFNVDEKAIQTEADVSSVQQTQHQLDNRKGLLNDSNAIESKKKQLHRDGEGDGILVNGQDDTLIEKKMS